jgi:hypothetical protein
MPNYHVLFQIRTKTDCLIKFSIYYMTSHFVSLLVQVFQLSPVLVHSRIKKKKQRVYTSIVIYIDYNGNTFDFVNSYTMKKHQLRSH